MKKKYYYLLLLSFIVILLFSCSYPSNNSNKNGKGTKGTKRNNEKSTYYWPPIVEPDVVNNCGPVPDGYDGSTGSGKSYYIDPVNGDDTNPGTFDEPWQTSANIFSYALPDYRPSGWIELKPGDVVYFMEGTHNTVLQEGDAYNPTTPFSPDFAHAVIHLSGVSGTEANPITIRNYPGHHAVIDPHREGVGVWIDYSSYINVKGLEIRNSRWQGMNIRKGNIVINIHRMLVHNTSGKEDNNMSGIRLEGTDNSIVSEVILYDNYDREAAGSGTQSRNSMNMVLFHNSGDIIIKDSIFFQTGDSSGQYSGGGLKYKHPQDWLPDAINDTFEMYGCYFENNKYFAAAFSSHNTYVHHNIMNVSGTTYPAIESLNMAGTTHQINQVFEYNTIYGGTGLDFKPYTGSEKPGWDDLTGNEFNYNIVYSLYNLPSMEKRAMEIGIYMSTALYNELLTGISFNFNCYFNPYSEICLGYGEGDQSVAGGAFTLTGWQIEYGWDIASIFEDPNFTDVNNLDFHVQNINCNDRGAYANGWEVNTNKTYFILGTD